MKARSYVDVLHRIQGVASRDPSWRVSEIALLFYPPDHYPLVALRRPGEVGVPRLSLSAGIHGDEVAGVEALLRFLESDLPRRFASVPLIVLPCQNPFGFEHHSRFNGCGLDLNRQFDKPDTPAPESIPLKRFLLQHRPDEVVECHEDSDADGFYLWEIKRPGRPEIGRAVVNRIATAHAVTAASAIEGCFVTDGVAHPTAERIGRIGGWSHTYFLFQNGTAHCLTPETPSSRPFEERVDMHLTAIHTVLERM